jgi:DNA polymerase III epsilon subunit-like protein
VADCPLFEAIKDEVRAALDVDTLVAHNAHVDVGVLQRKLGDWKCPEIFDTLKLARRLVPDESSYKLGSLIDAFNLAGELSEGLTPHRATYDALVAARLFVRLASRTTTLEELRGDSPGGGDSDEAQALF